MTAALALVQLRQSGVRVKLNAAGVVMLDAAHRPPAGLLALARAHRDDIRALLQGGGADAGPSLASLPGVPADWCEGVAALATMAAPSGVTADRWGELARTSQRLVRDHGAALHAAGWRTLDLFGLHRCAPAAYPPGWGLAWLLGARGDVTDLAADAIGIRREPGGARLAFRRRVSAAGLVAAWSTRQLRIATIPALRVESFGQYPRADGYPQLPLRGYAQPGPARTWLPQVVCAAAPSRSGGRGR